MRHDIQHYSYPCSMTPFHPLVVSMHTHMVRIKTTQPSSTLTQISELVQQWMGSTLQHLPASYRYLVTPTTMPCCTTESQLIRRLSGLLCDEPWALTVSWPWEESKNLKGTSAITRWSWWIVSMTCYISYCGGTNNSDSTRYSSMLFVRFRYIPRTYAYCNSSGTGYFYADQWWSVLVRPSSCWLNMIRHHHDEGPLADFKSHLFEEHDIE